jgi:hypothetical protein
MSRDFSDISDRNIPGETIIGKGVRLTFLKSQSTQFGRCVCKAIGLFALLKKLIVEIPSF